MSAQRVVVIGAGAIGMSIAWRLAQHDVRVVVIDPNQPGSKATWAAAGMLLPLFDNDTAFHSLAEPSFHEYPAFVEELHGASGIDPELIIEAPHTASVDNRKLGQALQRAAKRTGVEFRIGVAAREVICASGHFQHVLLADGSTVKADAVVIAAGAWSGELLGLPLRLPVVPVRGQMIAVQQTPPFVHHIIEGERCYLVPRGERLLIGATLEQVGFDERTTQEGINAMLTCGIELEPRIADAPVLETWAGLRPGTPDNLPILGADSHIQGVFYATGHYRNGILLTPITARLLAELITTGKTSIDLADFSVARFVVSVDDPRCDLCGAPMKEWHCRIICTGCGYQRDCSDP